MKTVVTFLLVAVSFSPAILNVIRDDKSNKHDPHKGVPCLQLALEKNMQSTASVLAEFLCTYDKFKDPLNKNELNKAIKNIENVSGCTRGDLLGSDASVDALPFGNEGALGNLLRTVLDLMDNPNLGLITTSCGLLEPLLIKISKNLNPLNILPLDELTGGLGGKRRPVRALGALLGGLGGLGPVGGLLGGSSGNSAGLTQGLGDLTGMVGSLAGGLGGVTEGLTGLTGALGSSQGQSCQGGGSTGGKGIGNLANGLTSGLGGLTGGLGGLTGGLGGLTGGLGGLTGGLGGLMGGLGGLTGGLGGLTNGLGGLTGGLGGLAGGLGALGGLTGALGGLGGLTSLAGGLGGLTGTLGGIGSIASMLPLG